MATISTTSQPAAAAAADDDEGMAFLTPQRIRWLGIGGAALLVVALAVWFTITAGRRKESYAAAALEQARDAAAQNNYGVAAQAFSRVASTYSGTAAGYEATLGIAQIRLINGQNELAISTLNDFLRTNPPPIYSSPANSLLGTAYENTGKFAEAVGAYRKASTLASSDYLKATALLDAGRAARLAGKPDDAKAIYNEIITKYGKTAAVTEAQVRLAELVASGG